MLKGIRNFSYLGGVADESYIDLIFYGLDFNSR